MALLVEGDKELIADISRSIRDAGTQVTDIETKSFGPEVFAVSIVVPISIAVAQIIHDRWLAKRDESKIIKLYINGVEINPKEIVAEVSKGSDSNSEAAISDE